MAKKQPCIPQCFHCDKPGIYLCDFILDWGCVLEKPLDESMTPEEIAHAILHPKLVGIRTCDRPLCEDHRVFLGSVFVDGAKKYTGVESRDLCPAHAKTGMDHKPPYNPIGGPRRSA